MSRIAWVACVMMFVGCSGSPKATTCPVCPVCPAEKTDPPDDDTLAKPVHETPPTSSAKPIQPATKVTVNDLEPGSKPGKSGSQADIAARSNAEGVALAKGKLYGDASSKFRDAVARVPEPAYFVNLCFALFHEGRFGEALTACKAVTGNPGQNAKRDKLIEHILYEASAQRIDVNQ